MKQDKIVHQFKTMDNLHGHYLLTVTEKLSIYELIGKLKWIADRMSVMKDARKAL